MNLKIALAGNPNSGKTTLFNLLTGSNQFVGNWPGVTVEKKEGKIRRSYGDDDLKLVDLPGIYSLSPYTLEEVVARNFLIQEQPDCIINIVDGSNLERNLYLTTQLLELGIPSVLAINMMDIVRKNGDEINTKKLSEQLGVPVIEISALKNENLDKLVDTVKAQSQKSYKSLDCLSESTKKHVAQIEPIVEGKVVKGLENWYAQKLLEADEKVLEELKLDKPSTEKIDTIREDLEEAMDDDTESIITSDRYHFISNVIKKSYKQKEKGLTISDKIDKIVTNRFLALPIFAVVMFLVYYISVTTVGTYVTDWTNDGLFGDGFSFFGQEVPGIPVLVEGFLENVGASEWLSGLILDGIVAGVGAVLGFVPQMFVLFFLLSFLEGCGYMARVAFIMDRAFRKFGLSGKSFIPMLISTGCGVPGVMASRTIENDSDRRMTVMTTTFMPCGAKMPIIALIAGAIFGGAGWVATLAYFIGVFSIIISGIILKKTKRFAGDPSPFIIELPAYHFPTLRTLWTNTWERGFSFIKKAGSIILLSTILVWFLSSFGWEDGAVRMVDMDSSFLAAMGTAIAWLFQPLGFGNWRAAVATITGLVAKENVVGTFGILYNAVEEVSEDGVEIWSAIAAAYTPLAAFSFMLFNLLCAPCFAAIGAIRREMGSWNWTLFAVGYQCVYAYIVALVVYQIGTLIATGQFGFFTIVAFLLLVLTVWLLFRPAPKQGPVIAVEEG